MSTSPKPLFTQLSEVARRVGTWQPTNSRAATLLQHKQLNDYSTLQNNAKDFKSSSSKAAQKR